MRWLLLPAEIIQLGIILAMFLGALLAWPLAPDQLPVHWDISGRADRLGGKAEALLTGPLLALGLYLLFAFLPLADRAKSARPGFARSYAAIRVATIGVIAAVHSVQVTGAAGSSVPLGAVSALAVGTLLIAVGAALPGLPQNWFVGVRTPWTMSSARSWERTHAFGRPVMVATGILFDVTAVVVPENALSVVIVGLIALAVALTIFSYVEWRRDVKAGEGLGRG